MRCRFAVKPTKSGPEGVETRLVQLSAVIMNQKSIDDKE